MLLFAIAIVAMAFSDMFDAFSTVAEATDKARLAGLYTAADNTLALGVGIIGADTLLTKGLGQALVLGVVVFITTYVTTSHATAWANRKVKQ